MVEKMSGSGTPNRAQSALFIRAESIKKWKLSDTAKEKPIRTDEQFTIRFDKGTVFLSAVASADIDETIKLLDEGVDIDYRNNDGLTALHQACIDENEEMVNLLIERGANIEAVDNEGWTPLHAAASAGNVDIAQILVDNDANLAAVNNEGEVPLDLAEEDEMDEFLSEEIDNQELEVEDARNEEERLMIEDATSWLNQKRIDETLDWQEATALHVAAAKGYNKVISTILQIGNVDVNVRDADGWAPIHAAVHWGSKTACELLTEAGADFDLKNNNGQTPCDLAEPEFVKTAENCRKRAKELAKKPNFKNKQRGDTDMNDNSIGKEMYGIELLKTKPPRPAVKGGRAKALNQQNNSEPEASPEEEEESEESEPEPEPEPEPTPAPTKTSSVSMSKTSSTSDSSNNRISVGSRFGRDRDEKKDTNMSPSVTRTSVGIGISRVGKQRDPEPEPTKPVSSRFGQSRNDRVGGFRTEEKKSEEPTTTPPTRNAIASRLNERLSASSRDEKEENNSIMNRYRPSSDSNWRTRKKDDENDSQEPETKRNTSTDSDRRIRSTPSSTDDDSSRTMSIAERLRKKNQELLASTSSDRALTERNSRDSNSSSSISSIRNTTRTSLTSSSDTGDTKDLQRKLDQALKEAEDYKSKYEKMKKEKDELEKQLDQYKEDIDKMQELKSDNIRLKDENGALIRVISKLSRTPASSS